MTYRCRRCGQHWQVQYLADDRPVMVAVEPHVTKMCGVVGSREPGSCDPQ